MEHEKLKFIYITCSDTTEAEDIAEKLLNEKLVACTNIINDVKSMYLWFGKTDNDTESILIVKTTEMKLKKAVDKIKEIHSYETPCILVFEAISANPDYTDWINSEIQ